MSGRNLLLACAECGAYLSAEPLVDRDGSRLFGCCACGYATVEFSFPSEVAVRSSLDGVTGTAVLEAVVSFSSC